MVDYYSINKQITLAQSQTLKGNAAIVDCGDSLILIDTLLLPKDVNDLKKHLLSLNKPLKYIINTHWHSDHCYGNSILKQDETLIIAHKFYWETLITEKNMFNPSKKYVSPLNNYCRPEILLNNDFSFTNNLSFQLLSTPGHSFDSLCVYLKDLKILISGDTILGFPQDYYSIPYFYWGNEFLFIKSLKKLLNLDIDLIIPGHSNPVNKEIISEYLEYLIKLIDLCLKYQEEIPDLTYEELLKLIKPDDCLTSLKKIPLWVPDMHTLNLQRIFLTYFHNNNSL